MALFNVDAGTVVKSTLIKGHATNKIIVDPNRDEGLEFITIGSKGSFIWWKVDFDDENGEELELKF